MNYESNFIDKDESRELKCDKVFDVLLQESNRRKFVYMHWIDIHSDEPKSCPYQSMDALLNNWEFVEE